MRLMMDIKYNVLMMELKTFYLYCTATMLETEAPSIVDTWKKVCIKFLFQ